MSDNRGDGDMTLLEAQAHFANGDWTEEQYTAFYSAWCDMISRYADPKYIPLVRNDNGKR